jgi:raffinose/stachyose/melibiose transport system permease protein
VNRITAAQGHNFSIRKIILFTLLFFIAAVQIFPLIWLLNFSVASTTEMFTQSILIKPERIRWDNYTKAFIDGYYLLYLRNSIIINTLVVLLVLIISVMTAFACTRMRWKLAPVVRNMLLLGMMIPIHATLIPNFYIYNRIHMTNTLWALLVPYVAFSLPQGLFITSGYMESIPREFEEAAIIDGCNIYRLIISVIIPMLQVALITVSIMTYLGNWNEFIMAMTFLSKATWKTLPFSVLEFTGQYRKDYAVLFAVMVLSALPSVSIYIILNKHITKGVALGAIKG